MNTLDYSLDACIGFRSLQAVYALNEYLGNQITAIEDMNFYPGNSAPLNAGTNFVEYTVIPTTDSEFFMLHTDRIMYKICHTNFEKLNQIVYIFNNVLNVDDIEGTITEPNIRFQFSHSLPVNAGNDFLEDMTPYFYQIVQCTIVYQIL